MEFILVLIINFQYEIRFYSTVYFLFYFIQELENEKKKTNRFFDSLNRHISQMVACSEKSVDTIFVDNFRIHNFCSNHFCEKIIVYEKNVKNQFFVILNINAKSIFFW